MRRKASIVDMGATPSAGMRPIHDRAGVTYDQALKCVRFRVPRWGEWDSTAYLTLLGLRYGLVGVAASHALVLSTDPGEEHELMAEMRGWPDRVQGACEELRDRSGEFLSPEAARGVARCAYEPIEVYVPQCRCLGSLERSLALALDEFLDHHSRDLTHGTRWLKKRRAMAQARQNAEQSGRYALNFFERRRAGLEEVREIALLDE